MKKKHLFHTVIMSFLFEFIAIHTSPTSIPSPPYAFSKEKHEWSYSWGPQNLVAHYQFLENLPGKASMYAFMHLKLISNLQGFYQYIMADMLIITRAEIMKIFRGHFSRHLKFIFFKFFAIFHKPSHTKGLWKIAKNHNHLAKFSVKNDPGK